MRRTALLLSLPLLLLACDSAAPEPAPTAEVTIAGDYMARFDAHGQYEMGLQEGEALVAVIFPPALIIATDFSMTLTAADGSDVQVHIARQRERRPDVGRYVVGDLLSSLLSPADVFYAGVRLPDRGDERLNLDGLDGFVDITRSEPGLIEGTFEFAAEGRPIDPDGNTGETVRATVSGTFRSSGEDA